MPKITVLLPVFNSANYLRETMESLFAQTWTDWNMIAVCELSIDNSVELLQEYARQDDRITLVVNETKLGLAESLNKGMRMANGEYIARIDAGDIALPDRLKKQNMFLDSHPNIGLVGTYQEHFGTKNWIHKPVISPEEQKVMALFHCDICHSTIMFRRRLFVENGLFYDGSYLAEDYELWTRAVQITDFATIPEVLGRYRLDSGNITNAKRERINIESGFITSRELQKNLHMEIDEADYILLRSWSNVFQEEKDEEKRRDMLERYRRILGQIWFQNQQLHVYSNEHLLYRLYSKWRWAKHGENWKDGVPIDTIDAILDPKYEDRVSVKMKNFYKRLKNFNNTNPSLGSKIKKLLKIGIRPLTRPFFNREERVVASVVDKRVWKAEQNILATLDNRMQAIDNRMQAIDNRMQATQERMDQYSRQVHRHIDFTYRDMMTLLRDHGGVWGQQVDLVTDYPIAYESNDTLTPHGTIRDNTRFPRFIHKCEMLFDNKLGLRFMDLGCSGGGMVLDALLRGHYALGLEGCDLSLIQQRAEWRLIPEHLKTCDITKPFTVLNHDSKEHFEFNIISAWEVLEHIHETDIPGLLSNIHAHLSENGVFVASIANWDDIDPETGVNWHVTRKEYEWWKDTFTRNGFDVCSELFETADLARGAANPPKCYEDPADISTVDLSTSFHLAARKAIG